MSPLRRLRPSDDGMAMIYAIAVIMLAMLLGSVLASYAVTETHVTGRDRGRVQAVAAAEGGLNLAYADMQGATTSLPCTVSGSVGSGANLASYSATITYYDEYPANDQPLLCSTSGGTTTLSEPVAQDGNAAGATVTAGAAVIASIGTATVPLTVSREMQALVQLVPSQPFDKAIFSNGPLTFNNNATIYGDGQGDDADIYTNAPYTCSNNQMVYGSVYVEIPSGESYAPGEGTITASNTCSAAVDWYAIGNITSSQGSSIGNDVLSSRGSINLASNTTVTGSTIAATTNNCGYTYGGVCMASATIPDPPYNPFPEDEWNPTAWTGAGWTVVTNNDCGTDSANVYNAITAATTASTPTVVYTSCALSYGNQTTLTLAQNVGIVTTGGFNAGNNFSVATSPASTTRQLFLMVPYNSSMGDPNSAAWQSNCSGYPSITATQRFNTSSTTDLFLYSPGPISINNNNIQYGEIYGGCSVSITNHYQMTYVNMSPPGQPVNTLVTSYQADIVYEREMQPGS
jgi:hypothetical protein